MAGTLEKRRAAIKREREKRSKELEAAKAKSEDKIDVQLIAYENRINPDADAARKVENRRNREELFTRNYRWIDARDLEFNKENHFEINEESIEGLAELILATGNTDPIIVREVVVDGRNALQVVDGERRTRAHLLLGERIDSKWYMIPTRYYVEGELSDEDALVLLNSENLGQRIQTLSSRATAFAAIADMLKSRKDAGDPTLTDVTIKDELAKRFGVSSRNAQINISIGRNLIDKGLRMLDQKMITLKAAEVIASLAPEDQERILDLVESGDIAKDDVAEAARAAKQGNAQKTRRKAPPSFDGYIESSIRSLKRAIAVGGKAQRKHVAAIRDLLEELDPDVKEELGLK